jgi:hypothetical protein
LHGDVLDRINLAYEEYLGFEYAEYDPSLTQDDLDEPFKRAARDIMNHMEDKLNIPILLELKRLVEDRLEWCYASQREAHNMLNELKRMNKPKEDK